MIYRLELEHLRRSVSHLSQHSSNLLLVSGTAQYFVHDGRTTDKDHDIISIASLGQILLDLGRVDESPLPAVLRVLRLVAQHVDVGELSNVLFGPRIEHFASENVVASLGAVEEGYFGRGRGGSFAEDGVKGLHHGRDSGTSSNDSNLLVLEWRLDFDIEINVLEINRSTHSQILAQILGHESVLPVILNQKIETSHLIICANRRIRSNDIHHLSLVGIHQFRLGEYARAGAQSHRLGGVRQSESQDEGRAAGAAGDAIEEGYRLEGGGELTFSGRDEGAYRRTFG
mmetsp:Transcript_24176/g.39266  ORF Transcript_24176/g.39266 Transcript_24176/m.39266 type:complete len:286 (-) Transcript_24176:99-956(-)